MNNMNESTNDFNTNGVSTGETDGYAISEAEKENMYAAKENGSVVMGTVGAILGGLLGVALWMVIYHAGYISVLGGIAIIGLSTAGYRLLGKEINRTGAIAVFLVCVIMVYVANYLSWSLEVYLELKKYSDEIEFGEVAKNIRAIIKETDLYGSYIKDLVLGYLFTLLGLGGAISKK